MSQTVSAPVMQKDRIKIIDIIRGVALFIMRIPSTYWKKQPMKRSRTAGPEEEKTEDAPIPALA